MRNDEMIEMVWVWVCFGLIFWAVTAHFGALAGFGAVAAIRLLMPWRPT